VPVRLREELTEDYRRMIYGDAVAVVQQERTRFTKKWQLRCPAVVESLKEAGDELFTFLRAPSSQWKALRTTMLSSASTRSSAVARRRKRVCQGRTRWCCCSSGCCAAGRSNCECLMGTEI
jgi:transposase-like protein